MSETKIAVPFIASLPDSEVTAKPQRRVYAAEEKKRILEAIDRAVANGGGVGTILRRESPETRSTAATESIGRRKRETAPPRSAFTGRGAIQQHRQ